MHAKRQDEHQQKEQLMLFISKYLRDFSITVEGLDFDELVERLYQEMAEYSILTRFLFSTGVEEININSWKDVKVTWSSGRTETLLEHFNSLRYGVSMCITGATGSGKTTLMSWVLSTIPDEKRVFSIENGVREFDLSRAG